RSSMTTHRSVDPPRLRLASAAGFAFMLTACNAITGASEYVIDEDLRIPTTPGNSASSSSASSSSSSSAGVGGAGGSGGSAGTGGAGADETSSSSSSTGSSSSRGTPTCAPCGSNGICNEATLTCLCSPGFVSDGT